VPKDTPIITSHCLVGLLAVACGFKRVVNLVIDNHAQYFIVVPGAINLVQGPTNYHRLLRMGVPALALTLAPSLTLTLTLTRTPPLILILTLTLTPTLTLTLTLTLTRCRPRSCGSRGRGSLRTSSTTSRPTARRVACSPPDSSTTARYSLRCSPRTCT